MDPQGKNKTTREYREDTESSIWSKQTHRYQGGARSLVGARQRGETGSDWGQDSSFYICKVSLHLPGNHKVISEVKKYGQLWFIIYISDSRCGCHTSQYTCKLISTDRTLYVRTALRQINCIDLLHNCAFCATILNQQLHKLDRHLKEAISSL